MVSPASKLVALLIAAIALFASGWGAAIRYEKGRQATRDLKAAQELNRSILMRHERQNVAAQAHEADKERTRTQYVTITRTVEKIVKEPFYASPDAPACLSDDGLRVLRDAIAGREPTGQPDATLPGPAKP